MSDIELNSGAYRAKIRLNGAGLNSLTFEGRNLIEPYSPLGAERYNGDVLAPWPNRIRDGKYIYQGVEYQLELTEPARKNALHGLVNNNPWSLVLKTASRAELTYSLHESKYYPTTLKLVINYELTERGLLIEIKGENIGQKEAPFGVSIHPYLIADPESRVDSWSLKMPASKYFRVDEQRLLPIEVESTPPHFDFRNSQQIRDTFIDHAFLVDEGSKQLDVQIVSPSGIGVGMSYSKNLKWIQIHTADRDGGADARRCLAVEPMTCPPDAFNSGIDLVNLLPAQSETSFWKIFAL
jgi:aldose 1-epimerase